MGKQSAILTLAGVKLDPSSKAPLHRQIYGALREVILEGRVRAGMRLPSTRALAAELGVSRTTVVIAFDQLMSEGYITGRGGSGTFVADSIPDDLLRVRARSRSTARQPHSARTISRRGSLLASAQSSFLNDEGGARAFKLGLPAIDAFPFDVWSKLSSRVWRRPPPDLAGYGNAAGYNPLREAIANYLSTSRGVRCETEQVIIVSGSQQGLDLAARVLLDPGDSAWIEDPGYRGAHGALLGSGARLAPVPVDDQGLDVAAGEALCSGAKLAYVTPSHQYPLGVTMSLGRRLALLAWASRSGSWILEDDYDSEYRYSGRPLTALQGLDTEGRVIYVGTFSKVLLPALRLGYLVVPTDLIDAFIAAHSHSAYNSPPIEQAILAGFISDGHFARHVRRMRALYQERQAILIEAAERELYGLLEVNTAEAGMHLIGWLPNNVSDQSISRHAASVGVDVLPLSFYCIEAKQRPGLLLGYTGIQAAEVIRGAKKLAAALRKVQLLPQDSDTRL
jgi:GntR family transcriptional regulator/MocR family aminotransferase